MKYLVTLFIILFSVQFSYSQYPPDRQNRNGDCRLNPYEWQKRLAQIKFIRNETDRLYQIKQMVQVNCYTTNQIIAISGLLSSDINKLDLAKTAYKTVTDPENYLDMSDVFTRFSYAIRLYDFIDKNPISNNGYGNISGNNPNNPWNNAPTYPQTNNCMVGNNDFARIIITLKNETFDATKINVAKQIITAKRCFTTQQIAEIVTLFDFEDSKLDLVKFAFDYCTDRQNYYQIHDVFQYNSTKQKFTEYLRNKQQ